MKLSQTLIQVQTLSQRAIQSLEVLQMNRQELTDWLQNLSMENPVIELELPHAEAAIRPGSGQMHWLEETDRQNRWYFRQDRSDSPSSYDAAAEQQAPGMSLGLAVRTQLDVRDTQLDQAVYLLTESLDESGWLTDSLDTLSSVTGCSLTILEQALALVQSADPPGVGARNLKECLLLQMDRLNIDDPVARAIVEHHLVELAKSHYCCIAKALGISQDEVRHALELIQSLNPRPGSAFSHRDRPDYVVPDVIATPSEHGCTFAVSEASLPQIQISGYYTRLSKECDQPEVVDYLDQKLRQAAWVVSAVEQRKNTLLRCLEAIRELQPDFFYYGTGIVRPMTLSDVAKKVGVHESTVSRAVRGKYLQCSGGVIPLTSFFTRSATGGAGRSEMSSQEAKRRLQQLILGEDENKPYSDQKLSELLARQGCPIARRTVTKYREELGFGPASGRKKAAKL